MGEENGIFREIRGTSQMGLLISSWLSDGPDEPFLPTAVWEESAETHSDGTRYESLCFFNSPRCRSQSLYSPSHPFFCPDTNRTTSLDTCRSTSLPSSYPPPFLSLRPLLAPNLRRPLEQIPETIPLGPRFPILQLRRRNLSPRRSLLRSSMDPTMFSRNFERRIREPSNRIIPENRR